MNGPVQLLRSAVAGCTAARSCFFERCHGGPTKDSLSYFCCVCGASSEAVQRAALMGKANLRHLLQPCSYLAPLLPPPRTASYGVTFAELEGPQGVSSVCCGESLPRLFGQREACTGPSSPPPCKARRYFPKRSTKHDATTEHTHSALPFISGCRSTYTFVACQSRETRTCPTFAHSLKSAKQTLNEEPVVPETSTKRHLVALEKGSRRDAFAHFQGARKTQRPPTRVLPLGLD